MSWRHAAAGGAILIAGVLIGVILSSSETSPPLPLSAGTTSTSPTPPGMSDDAATTGATTIPTTTTTSTTTPTSTTIPPDTTTTTETTTTTTMVTTTTIAVVTITPAPTVEQMASVGPFTLSLSDHTVIVPITPELRFDLVYHEGVPAFKVNKPWWILSVVRPEFPYWECHDRPTSTAPNPMPLSTLAITDGWYACVDIDNFSKHALVRFSGVGAEQVTLGLIAVDLAPGY